MDNSVHALKLQTEIKKAFRWLHAEVSLTTPLLANWVGHPDYANPTAGRGPWVMEPGVELHMLVITVLVSTNDIERRPTVGDLHGIHEMIARMYWREAHLSIQVLR